MVSRSYCPHIVLILTALVLVSHEAGAAGDPRSMKAKAAGRQGAQTAVQAPQPSAPFGLGRPQALQYLDISKVATGPVVSTPPAAGGTGTGSTAREALIQEYKGSSRNWGSLTDPAAKEFLVSYFISFFRGRNIHIRKPVGEYVASIDGLLRSNPDMRDAPLDKVLEIIAVIEYDYDNGQDKDMMGRRLLGVEGWARNRKRLGLE